MNKDDLKPFFGKKIRVIVDDPSAIRTDGVKPFTCEIISLGETTFVIKDKYQETVMLRYTDIRSVKTASKEELIGGTKHE